MLLWLALGQAYGCLSWTLFLLWPASWGMIAAVGERKAAAAARRQADFKRMRQACSALGWCYGNVMSGSTKSGQSGQHDDKRGRGEREWAGVQRGGTHWTHAM